jgi:hypothetical protein
MALGAALDAGLPAVLGGRYRLTRRIGQGSIAQVLEAVDEVGGGTVALKILYPNLAANPAVADRFKREAQIVRRIAHRHVIAIHDVAESDGLAYLVMDVHPGGDLADRLARSGPLPVPTLRELGRQLGGALDAAHRAGVVHRDVKPQNVLVGPDAAALDTRLCDFGLARTADLAGLTTRSTVLGTPEYMAPEVISDGYADPRSDIYSLGIVLFEAATGRLPFRASSPFQLLRKQLGETPPRASAVRADLPPEIDEAIDRALRKEPLDRFACAADLVSALAPPAPGVAALAVRPPNARRDKTLASRATCRRCGGSVVRLAQVCVDCGARSLRVKTVPGGYAVLVTGPGRIADKLDGAAHVALVKLLDELPPGATRFNRLRKKPPRLPFFVLGDLDEPSAGELCARLRDIGFEARVERRASLAPPELRRKARTMTSRYAALSLTSAVSFGNALMRELFHHRLHVAALGTVFVGAFAAMWFLPAVTFRRPLVAIAETDTGQPALVRLAQWLTGLKRREDRRLLARILERLQLATELGAREAAELLAERAALACRGLAAIEERNRHFDESDLERRAATAGGDEVSAALGSLRDGERIRGVLLADLLRTFSRAEELCARLARAGGLAAGEQAALVARELADLEVEIEAEEDIAALLS